jgi:hypothetical protein
VKGKPQGRPEPAGQQATPAMAPLEELLDSRSREYLELCSTVPVSDERHTVYMRLYAACRRLSNAVKQRDATSAVFEIASNLMACEEVAILQVTANHNESSMLDSVGLSERQRRALESHAAQMAAETDKQRVFMAGEKGRDDTLFASLGIQAFVPLCQNRRVQGAIIFFNTTPAKRFPAGRPRTAGSFLGVCGTMSFHNRAVVESSIKSTFLPISSLLLKTGLAHPLAGRETADAGTVPQGSSSTTAIPCGNLPAPTKALYFHHLKRNMAIENFLLETRSNSIFLCFRLKTSHS